MSDDAQNPYLLYPERGVDKRVRYYDGQFLGSADFLLAQAHPIDRHRRHLANTVTAGVLDGYAVHGEADAVVIAPGTAVDHAGRPMVLVNNARRAIQAADRSKNLTLWIRYQEQADDESSEDKGASGLTRFDETPEIMYTADGQSLPEGVVIIARLQVDGAGNVSVDTTVRPRGGLRIPGPIPLTLTADEADPGRGTVNGALRMIVPDGIAAYGVEQPALDVRGHARVRWGMTIGQDSATGYGGVRNDGNDLVVNGQLAAGGGAGSAIYKLGVGYGPPSQGEGTLTAQRLAIGVQDTDGKALRVNGTARFHGYSEFDENVYLRKELRVHAGIDLAPNHDTGDIHAGMIRYQEWTDGLDIVGATTGDMQTRQITFHAQGGSKHIGNLRVEGHTVTTGDVNPGRHLQAGQDIRAGRNAEITGHTATNSLNVAATTTTRGLQANWISVEDRVTSQHLTVNGGSAVNTLEVGGAANLNGNVNVRGGVLNVTPVANFTDRVNVDGLLAANGRLMPSAGSSNSNGIVWPGQGNNDVGAIRFWKEGNNTRLVIDNQNNADDVIVLRQKGGDRLTVQNGRVGINHSTPASDLHVGGGAVVDNVLAVGTRIQCDGSFRPSTGTGSNDGIVWVDDAFGGSGDFARIQYASWGGENAALSLSIGNDANDIIVLKQQGGDRLTVKGGKVGINHTNPSHSLTVSGATYITGYTRIDGDLDLGAGDANREANAGKICYKTHSSDALEIIGGGGPNSSNRRVRVWSENGFVVHGWMHSKGDLRLHDNSNNKAMCSHSNSTRAIWGAVKSNGTRWCGSGFTCERYGDHTGAFIIRFNPKFSSRPAVVVTQHYPTDNDSSNSFGNTKDNAIVARTSKDWVIVVTGESDGDRKYRSFEFIAIGPV